MTLAAVGLALALAAASPSFSHHPTPARGVTPTIPPHALPGAAPPGAIPPARLQVAADEFRLTLSRGSLKAGPALIQLVNFGEDDHDLRLRRRAAESRVLKIPVAGPGERDELEARLRPGRYRLWCSIADHEERGMRATLVVRRAS